MTTVAGADQRGASPLYYYTRHLHENVLHHLAAVVVHADVTGEGFTEEDITVEGRGKRSGEQQKQQK